MENKGIRILGIVFSFLCLPAATPPSDPRHSARPYAEEQKDPKSLDEDFLLKNWRKVCKPLSLIGSSE
jgi:hypothetical protein